jgi:sarcosine dehydrogenase
MGPHARDVLEKVTSADVSNSAFPFAHVREIDIAGHTVRALRVTYVGELGWELHMPIGATGEIFDALDAGRKTVGYPSGRLPRARILRLEKGYRAWGSDITPNDTPHEAGLGWAVRRNSNTGFVGQQALAALAGQPLTKRFRRVRHRRSRCRPGRTRDHSAQWPTRRLPHFGRVWLHHRQERRLRLRSERRWGLQRLS